MSFLEMYYYLFYKSFKFFKFFNPKLRPAEISAVSIVFLLQFLAVEAIFSYYAIIFHYQEGYSISLFWLFVIIAIFSIIGWLAFWRNDNWRLQIDKFDKWTDDKNKKGTWIVIVLIIIIIVNFAISFYLNPPVNGWKQ